MSYLWHHPPCSRQWQADAHASSRRVRGVLCIALAIAMLVFVAWSYKQLPMQECGWCHTTGRLLNGLNRHHVVPQSVDPSRRDDPTNLIVLCRRCHYVLGHRCNWKTYNPDVISICETYTNCLPCEKGD